MAYKNKKLFPIVYQALTSYPFIEHDFDALTLYELISKICGLVNEMVPIINNMDTEIEAAVKDQLDEWLADGTIAELISELASANFQKNASIVKRGRFLIDKLTNPDLSYKGGQSIVYYGGKYYSAGQIGSSGPCYFTRWTENGVVELQANSNIVGHGNGITAWREKLYVSGDAGKFHILDLNFNYIDEIDASEYFTSSTGVGSDDQYIYLYGGARDLTNYRRIVKTNDGINFEVVCEFPNPLNEVRCDICIYDGYIYALFARSTQIYKIDMSGKIITIYDIPDGDGLYPMGEAEGLFIKNNSLYIWSAMYYFGRYGHYSTRHTNDVQVGYIFESDIITKLQSDIYTNYYSKQEDLEIELDEGAEYTFNPSLVVTTALEACALANYHKHATIKVSGGFPEGSVFCLNDANVSIYGTGGSRIIDVLQAVDSVIRLRNVQPARLYAHGSDINCNSGVNGELVGMDLYGSSLVLRDIDLSALEYWYSDTSEVRLLGIINTEIPDIMTVGGTIGSYLYIESGISNRTNLLKLAKMTDGAALITIYGESKFIGTYATATNIASSSRWTRPVSDASGEWSAIGVDSGGDLIAVISGVDTKIGSLGTFYITIESARITSI